MTLLQLERRIEASQEVIVDLQQTVEKFRELVRNQQSDIVELKQKEESQKDQGLEEQSEALHSLNRQLQATAIKAHSRVRQQYIHTYVHTHEYVCVLHTYV